MSRSLGMGRLLRVLSRPVRHYGSKPYSVQPYRGYGSESEAFLMGRVFRQPGGARRPGKRTGFFFAAFRRLLRWGARGARISATLDGRTELVTTDGDGYFRVHWRGLTLRQGDDPWHRVHLALLGPDSETVVRSDGEIYLAPPESERVVISDIDDTVVYTGVANVLVMLWQLFFKPASSRVAFPGVGAFYRALHDGASGQARNPMIFVSRAPWSIYEVLEEFFELHRIPGGPILFLREWGMTLQSPLPRRARDHKRRLVEHILDLYAGRPAVLIGDSGQHDPELYADVVARYPGRVQAVYIRDVSGTARRQASIGALAKTIETGGAEFVLSDETAKMAEHAAKLGLILADSPTAVEADAAHDKAEAAV